MENNVKEKNNSKGVIILLCIIIVVLLALCTLFATGTISLNNKQTSNEQTDNSSTQGEENTANKLTEEEATDILKSIFTNEAVRFLFDNSVNTYCKTDSETVSEEELGLNYKWNGYRKCTDYNSYEELINHFRQYITEDLLSKNTSQTHAMADGTILYKYYEKDGNLYAANTGKGGNVNKDKFLDDETTYTITSFDNKLINATVNAKWQDTNYDYYSELVKITLVKELDKWKVSSYEATEQ